MMSLLEGAVAPADEDGSLQHKQQAWKKFALTATCRSYVVRNSLAVWLSVSSRPSSFEGVVKKPMSGRRRSIRRAFTC